MGLLSFKSFTLLGMPYSQSPFFTFPIASKSRRYGLKAYARQVVRLRPFLHVTTRTLLYGTERTDLSCTRYALICDGSCIQATGHSGLRASLITGLLFLFLFLFLWISISFLNLIYLKYTIYIILLNT